MDIFQWIFGTDAVDVYSYIINHLNELSKNHVLMTYYSERKLFINSFCNLFFRYGIVGFVLYAKTIIARFQRDNYEAKSILWMYVISLFGQSILLRCSFKLLYYYRFMITKKKTRMG